VRILFITPSYHPRVGGVEYVVKSIAERLVKMGHEAVALAGEPGIETPAEEEINGVHVVRWPTWSPGGAYHIPKRMTDFEKLLKGVVKRSRCSSYP